FAHKNFICIFAIFIKLSVGVLCSCWAHTKNIGHLADSANFMACAFNKIYSGLIGRCFKLPNAPY
ncbi:MAG: hypothetical protein K8R58_07395, partial [Bacteroidales bacterium]|nr:hypothetical protein [Bacteroidales bacterium]